MPSTQFAFVLLIEDSPARSSCTPVGYVPGRGSLTD